MRKGILWLTGLEKYLRQDPELFIRLCDMLCDTFRHQHMEVERCGDSLVITHPENRYKTLVFFSQTMDSAIKSLIYGEVDRVIFMRRPVNVAKRTLIDLAAHKDIPFVTQPLTEFDYLPGTDDCATGDEPPMNYKIVDNSTHINGDINITINTAEKSKQPNHYKKHLWSFLIGVLVNITTGNCRWFN